MINVCFGSNKTNLLNNVVLQEGRASREKDIGKSIILSVAYAANIGGIATLIGTPANLILKENADA